MKFVITFWDKYAAKYLEQIARLNVIVLILIYLTITFIGYKICGETSLISDVHHFIYYMVVTASTTGYGDAAPTTPQGEIFTAVWVIPFALGLFGLSIGKGAFFLSQILYRRYRGKHMLTLKNHIVILGYSKTRTAHLVRMLQREEKGRREIVLVSVELEENPFDDSIHFISADSFTEEADLARANIREASCIVVDLDLDDATLTVALFASTLNKKADLVANFVDEVKCRILTQHIPNAECISGLGTELLAKSVIDSGSSFVHSELVSAHKGQTQYSIKVPNDASSFALADVFMSFKVNHEATVIAIRKAREVNVTINAKLDALVNPGDQLFYIADERVNFNDWPSK
ncbi:voltage-gated potassium channel [Vibrio xiamenensis]|uniref:Voltage-gated potassium channel n=1 Tax=Vibrio xiamenensis TaxID=861298 RepID=A0A1G8A135_9VIBR|nr:potassium channel family protein [Vibrio xiamenensis]SDH14561.1 voltage-gated potassium channel [Vibrio xiamenensis]